MAGIVDILMGPVSDILDKFIPDADKKIAAKLELAKLADADAQRAHEEMIAQTEVNKVEAGHRSIFVAGWRPAMGWIGASGLFTIYVIQPIYNLYHGLPSGIDSGELMV